jgi:hypothetical protein
MCWRRTARDSVHALLHDMQRPQVLHGGAAAMSAPRKWDLVETAAQSVYKLVADHVKGDPWHSQKNSAGVGRAIESQSKAPVKSARALSAEQERKIMSDARHAASQSNVTVAMDDLCSYSEKHDRLEFKPPSTHRLMQPIMEAFTLLRDQLSRRAAERPGEVPTLNETECDMFRLCENFTKKFLIEYVACCSASGHADLRSLMTRDSDFKKRSYASTYRAQVQDNICEIAPAHFASAIAAAKALVPDAEMPGSPLDLSAFMGRAAAAQERVSALIRDFVQGCEGTRALRGKLKGAYRVIEKALKSMRGPLEALGTQWSYEKANDCARGGIECDSMQQCTACIGWISGMQRAGTILLLKVKDRYSDPTDGGWSDFLVMFMFPNGAGQFVPCEIQIMHEKLLAARKGLKAHEAYDGFRAACETLALIERLPDCTSSAQIAPTTSLAVQSGSATATAAAAKETRVVVTADASAGRTAPGVALIVAGVQEMFAHGAAIAGASVAAAARSETGALNAQAEREGAESARGGAEAAQGIAEVARGEAEAARDGAEAARGEAEASQAGAEASAGRASASAEEAAASAAAARAAEAAAEDAKRSVVQIAVLDTRTHKLVDIGSGAFIGGGHVLSAAHVVDTWGNTQDYHILLGTFEGDEQCARWSFAAEPLTPLSLRTAMHEGFRLDLVVLRVTHRLRRCVPERFLGLRQEIVDDITRGALVALQEPDYDVELGDAIAAAALHEQCPPLLLNCGVVPSGHGVAVLGYPILKAVEPADDGAATHIVRNGHHMHVDIGSVTTKENGFLQTRAFIETGSSGGPAIYRDGVAADTAGQVVGVVSRGAGIDIRDGARAPKLSYLRSLSLLTAEHFGGGEAGAAAFAAAQGMIDINAPGFFDLDA